MSDDNKKNDDAIDFFTKMVNLNGVAVSTVKDGSLLMFKREWLEKLLDTTVGKEQVVIFVKRPEFKN